MNNPPVILEDELKVLHAAVEQLQRRIVRTRLLLGAAFLTLALCMGVLHRDEIWWHLVYWPRLVASNGEKLKAVKGEKLFAYMDRAGRVRARCDWFGDGGTVFGLSGSSGTPQIMLSADVGGVINLDDGRFVLYGSAETTGFMLMDGHNVVRAGLLLDAEGNPWFNLTDKQGRKRVELRIEDSGEPRLRFFSENGELVPLSAAIQ